MSNYIQETVNLLEIFSDTNRELFIDGKIYKITNLITGMVYIGQTKYSIERRLKGHIADMNNNSDLYIHRSMRKHGIENFTIEQVDSGQLRSELNQKEYEWIIKENCLAPNGYNLRAGGLQTGFSVESKKKMSESRRLANLGKKWFHDRETQKEYFIHDEDKSDTMIDGRNDDHIMRNIINVTGRKHSSETKEKMIASHQKADKIKLSESRRLANLGKKWFHDPLTQQEYFIHEEYKSDNIIDGRNRQHTENRKKMIGFKQTEEAKKRISDASKNSRYYHNLESMRQIRLCCDDEIPEGFIKGKLPIKRKWYCNLNIMKELLIIDGDEIPDGFCRGRIPFNSK